MPKIPRALTAREVKELSKIVGDHSVGGVKGLILRVVEIPSGISCYWQLRRQGAEKFRATIGGYPEISVDEARGKANALLLEYKDQNIVAAKAEKRKKAASDKLSRSKKEKTIAELLPKWLDWKEARGEWKNSQEARYKAQLRLDRHIVPYAGHISVAEATPDDIAALLASVWIDMPATGNILLALLKGFFVWAASVAKIRDPQKINPASWEHLKLLLAPQSARKDQDHFPYLEPEQLPPFFKALSERDGVAPRCTAFAILTCVRSGNARFARWEQIDFEKKTWTIDAKDMKVTANGQHIIPLSRQALKILKFQWELRNPEDGGWVFPSPRRRRAALGNTALNTVIKDLHTLEVLAGREGWIDRKQSAKSGEPVIAVQHAISRATFESWAHLHHADERAVHLVLHHNIDARLKSAYDRADSLDDKKALLQRWADFCYSF